MGQSISTIPAPMYRPRSLFPCLLLVASLATLARCGPGLPTELEDDLRLTSDSQYSGYLPGSFHSLRGATKRESDTMDKCMLHKLTLVELFSIVKTEVAKFENCLREQE